MSAAVDHPDMALELDVDPDQGSALPPNGAAFLDALAASLDDEAVVSVVLFGSVVSGETAAVSDVDLLVVLADDVGERRREALRSEVLALAEAHLAVERDRANAVERVVDRATGMFRSGFVVADHDVETGRFHAVFNTSRLAYLLAPWRTVLRAAFARAETVYGPMVTPDWSRVTPPSSRRGRELARSWLTASLLSTAQLLYGFVSSRAVRYSMEAHKWTLYNCAFHLTGGRASTLSAAVDAVPGVGRFDQRLLALRDSPRFDRAYVALVPLYVTFLHVRSLLSLVWGHRAGRRGD